MKFTVIISALIALALPLPSLAEDIDLFLGSPPADDNKPNVLIILDNTANWNTAFENEKDALEATFDGMDPNAFNVGLMMFGESPNLGYVRAAVRPMSAMDPNGVSYNKLYADMIGSFDVSTGTGDGGNARTLARTFAEAYRYLKGEQTVDTSENAGYGKNVKRDWFQNGVGTTQSRAIYNRPGNAFRNEPDDTYDPPPEPGVCAETYVIYIGNTIPSGNVTKDNTSRNTAAKNNLETAATAAGVSPSEATALITAGYTYTAHQGNYADEWARFMHDQENVIFYAVDVDPTPHPDYDGSTGHNNGMGNSDLLRSLSQGVGGGKYFRVDSQVGGGGEVANALGEILTEIQAENSVFASVALPASTTGQSVFLNQVFIGLFRPDGNAYPRWPGNLKQYQLGKSAGTIKLFDAKDDPAINTSTGFVTECARSFWTEAPSVGSPDTYWSFAPQGLCGANEAARAVNRVSNTPDGPYVEKGAQGFMLREGVPASRNVYTCGQPTGICTARTDFNNANITGITEASLDANDPTDRTRLIAWAIGADLLDENGDTLRTDTRASVHGDVIHSRPVALNYGDNTTPQVVVFYGGNDGMLRAVNGNQQDDTVTTDNVAGFEPGEELWSFVPPEFYGEFKRLALNTEQIKFPATGPAEGSTGTRKAYGMDGPITAFEGASDFYISALRGKKYIYAGMRRGGRAVYAFDVSDPNDPPSLLWKRGCDTTECSTDFSSNSWTDIGQTWSQANIAYPNPSSHANPVLIMGGGYDECEDFDGGTGNANHSCDSTTGFTGDHIYVIDAVTGDLLQVFDTERPVPGGVTVVPITDPTNANPTPYVAGAYATDTGGNVYRISGETAPGSGVSTNIGSTAPSTWIITRIASFGCGEDADDNCTANRKFLFGPDVVRDLDDSAIFRILVGSGDREKPLLSYSAAADVQNYFFSFLDQPLIPDWLDDDDNNTCGADIICRGRLFDVTEITEEGFTIEDPDADVRGYTVELAATEQVVTGALVVGNVANFSTHIPYDVSADLADDADVCKNKLGTATTYNIDFADAGGETVDIFTGGLVPTPVAGLVEICDDEGNCTEEPFCIGCGGENSPIGGGTPSTSSSFEQSKGRVYWNVVQ